MADATAPAAEAVINADNEVMVVLSDAPGDASGWEAGPGPLLCIRLRDGGRSWYTLPDEALDAARANGRILLVGVGPDGLPTQERWVFAS